jgi:hypothetical protein
MANNKFKKKNAEKREYKKEVEVLKVNFNFLKLRIRSFFENISFKKV